MTKLKWLVILFLLAVLVLQLLVYVFQYWSERQDSKLNSPPGTLVEVDGKLMHLHCIGEGSPTVVIEQGTGSQSLLWADVHQSIAEVSRTCVYDRVGMGYSDPESAPISAKKIASNLHTLLSNASIDDQIILVGWSLGGIYAREFYYQYPDKVAGLLLVDSSHEQQLTRMPEPPSEEGINRFQYLKILGALGWLRASGYVEKRFVGSPYSSELNQRLIAIYNKSHTYGTLLNESISLEAEVNRDHGPKSLGDLPLVVLAEGKPNNAYMQNNLDTWLQLQQELAGLSVQGKLIIAENSAHAIHRSEPELIVEAVTGLVDLNRSISSL